MKRLKNATYEEIKEFNNLIAIWLKPYANHVINKIAPMLEDVYNNEFAIMCLKELKEREEKEMKEFTDDLYYTIMDLIENDSENNNDYHSHPLTHSKSYRDVLYDMYIKDLK